jgi:Putative auto-transporter adhesin, head GIN domain
LSFNYLKKIKNMKRINIIGAMLFALLIMGTSCRKVTGEGAVQTEQRSVGSFTGVSVNLAANVTYKTDSVYKIELVAQQNILNLLETYTANGRLVLKARNGVNLQTIQPIIIRISAPALNYISMDGDGDFAALDSLKAAGLELRVAGSGTITVPSAMATGSIDALISGSGWIRVQGGKTPRAYFRVSGSGKVLMDVVLADKAAATVSGSGSVQLQALQTLDATISGSGNIYYRGTPQVMSNITGSGRVLPL